MYTIGSLLSRITQPFRILFRGVTGPFHSLVYQVRSIRTVNPITQMGRSFRWMGGQVSYFAQLPARMLGIKTTKVRPLEWLRESIEDLLPQRDRRRKRVKVSQIAQYSQIHLVNALSGYRHIVHIGTIVGRSTSELTIADGTHEPVRFMFSQVDPARYGASLALSKIGGRGKVLVDGMTVKSNAPLKNHSQINVDDQVYYCELYAWDRTPIVTRVEAGWETSTGMVRDTNEDAIGIYQHPKAYLFAIADGVGGAQDGDRISEFAIRYLLAAFHKNVPYDMAWTDVLEKAFRYINVEVRNYVRKSAFPGGTTLTAGVIKNWEAHIAHVGDSQLFHWHRNALKQVTVDHVKREATIEMDTRHAFETETPPKMRDVLVRAIGKNDSIQPDIFTIRLQPGDRLLLCTDGITDKVDFDEIADFMKNSPIRSIPHLLVQLANERSTPDNSSAIAIDVMEEAYIEDTWEAKPEPRVYVGNSPLRALKLDKPKTMDTDPGVTRPNGCALLLMILLALAIVWGITRLTSSPQENNQAAATAAPAVTAGAATATPLPPTAAVYNPPQRIPRTPESVPQPAVMSAADAQKSTLQEKGSPTAHVS